MNFVAHLASNGHNEVTFSTHSEPKNSLKANSDFIGIYWKEFILIRIGNILLLTKKKPILRKPKAIRNLNISIMRLTYRDRIKIFTLIQYKFQILPD